MSARAETMRLVKELEKQGFRVVRAGSGNWRVSRPEGGPTVTFGFTNGKSPKTLKRLRELGAKV